MTTNKRRPVSLAVLALLFACADVQGGEPRRVRPKRIFAHHMACYPAGAAATAYHRMNDAHKVRHDGTRQHDAYGDRWRNWPLVPDGTKL